MRSRDVVRLVAVVSAALVIGSTAAVTPAAAQPVENGTATFVSEPGDWVGLGGSYSFDTATGDDLTVTTSSGDNSVRLQIFGFAGFWTVTLAAPVGQSLAPGVYPGAQHVAFRQPGAAGLEVTADGRGCSQVDSTFTVDAVTFGPNGYLQTLDASLEQYCDGALAALRGDLHIANPAPLQLDLTVNPDGIVSPVSGEAIISGTYSCSQNTTLRMSGRLAQVVKREIVSGMISIFELPCTAGAPIPWSTYVSTSGTPFDKGDAEALVFLRNADGTVMIERRVIVRLAKR